MAYNDTATTTFQLQSIASSINQLQSGDAGLPVPDYYDTELTQILSLEEGMAAIVAQGSAGGTMGDYWLPKLLMILVGYGCVLVPGWLLVRWVERRCRGKFLKC